MFGNVVLYYCSMHLNNLLCSSFSRSLCLIFFGQLGQPQKVKLRPTFGQKPLLVHSMGMGPYSMEMEHLKHEYVHEITPPPPLPPSGRS